MSPVGDGSLRFLRLFTSNGDNLCLLFRREARRAARTGSVGEHVFLNCFPQCRLSVAAFDRDQSLKLSLK